MLLMQGQNLTLAKHRAQLFIEMQKAQSPDISPDQRAELAKDIEKAFAALSDLQRYLSALNVQNFYHPATEEHSQARADIERLEAIYREPWGRGQLR